MGTGDHTQHPHTDFYTRPGMMSGRLRHHLRIKSSAALRPRGSRDQRFIRRAEYIFVTNLELVLNFCSYLWSSSKLYKTPKRFLSIMSF